MSNLAQRIAACLLVCFVCTLGYFSIVQASEIRTELCNPSATPSLSITSLTSDSIVDASDLRLVGTANNTSHIVVFVNGKESSTILVNSSGAVDTLIQLSEGTNSISLHAYYSCNQSSSITTFVVTYQPGANPSNGSSVVTVLPSPSNISQPNSTVSPIPSPTDQDPGDGENPGVSTPEKDEDIVTGSLKTCQDIYFISVGHFFALLLLSYLTYVTERLYKLASRTRRRPSKQFKSIVRTTIALLAILLVWFFIRVVINCV